MPAECVLIYQLNEYDYLKRQKYKIPGLLKQKGQKRELWTVGKEIVTKSICKTFSRSPNIIQVDPVLRRKAF